MDSENQPPKKDSFLQGLQNITFTKDTNKSPEPSSPDHRGPRFFTYAQKEECWNRSAIMIGRNPERWRLDAMGNPVFKFFRGCSGPLCHEYDHIIPFSKGGRTSSENCQVLQSTVNLYKSNKLDITYDDLLNSAPRTRFKDEHLDAIEMAAYGNIKRHTLDDIVDYNKTTNSSEKEPSSPKPRSPRRKKTEEPKPDAQA